MINDPLFIKTKNDLISWRAQKSYSSQKIPDNLKTNIIQLLNKYPRAILTQKLNLSASTMAAFVVRKSYDEKVLTTQNSTGPIFHQMPSLNIESRIQNILFEFEIPGKLTLRLFK